MAHIYCVHADYGNGTEDHHFYHIHDAKSYFLECVRYIATQLDNDICHPDWERRDDDGKSLSECIENGSFCYQEVSVYLETWETEEPLDVANPIIYRVWQEDDTDIRFTYFRHRAASEKYMKQCITETRCTGRDDNGQSIDECVKEGTFIYGEHAIYIEEWKIE